MSPFPKAWADPITREKWRARADARHAIAAGKLVRQPCEACGALAVEAHHDDYSRPLDVRWFCAAHHRAHHAAEKAAGREPGAPVVCPRPPRWERQAAVVAREAALTPKRQRSSTCKRGHPLSGDNLYVTPRGVRQCLECQRNRDRAYRARLASPSPIPNH